MALSEWQSIPAAPLGMLGRGITGWFNTRKLFGRIETCGMPRSFSPALRVSGSHVSRQWEERRDASGRVATPGII